MTAEVTSFETWSATAASNQPEDTDSAANLAENLRTIQAEVKEWLASSDTIASASTTDLATKGALYVTVTGTTTITALGTLAAGITKILIFDGALTFTHNATSLILPTGANITTAQGDTAIMVSLGSGNWRCVNYAKKNGAPLTATSAFADGSVTTPAINFAADTNTGIYRIGDDNIGIATNGTKRFDIAAATTITGNTTITGTATVTSTAQATKVTATSTDVPSFLTYGGGSGGFDAGGYGFTGDTDTYIASSAANTMNIHAGKDATAGTITLNTAYGETNAAAFTIASDGDYGNFTFSGAGDASTGRAFFLCSDTSTDGSGTTAAFRFQTKVAAGTWASYPVLQVLSDSSGAGPTLLEIQSTGYMCIGNTQTVGTGWNALDIYADIDGTPDKIFRVRGDGAVFADGAYTGTGADYAEYFDYTGDRPQVGDTVTLDGENVRIAAMGDEVIGVVSSHPAVVGDYKAGEDRVAIGLVGKLKVSIGRPVDPRWKKLKNLPDGALYLVR